MTQDQKQQSNLEDLEHDDLMDADDYERRQYEKDGWNESNYDRQRY